MKKSQDKPRLYVLGGTASGCVQREMPTEEARFRYLALQDMPWGDWYLLDVYPDGEIYFTSAPVGEDALSNIP